MSEEKWHLEYDNMGQLFVYEGDLRVALVLGGSKEKAIEVANKILAFPEMEEILVQMFIVLGKIANKMYYKEALEDGE